MAWRTRGAQRDRRDTLSRVAGFNGNFASLFTPGTVLQSVQTDLGLTYGGTPVATAGNTSTTVLTLTGTLGTVAVPIWAVSTNTLAIGAGAAFNIYYDGLGVTPAMTGVTPTAGVGVALTGAGTGLTMTWAAGTSVNANSWKACCSALADQSGNAKDQVSASLNLQPLIALGLNGMPALSFDGSNDRLSSALAISVPYFIISIFKVRVWAAGSHVYGDLTLDAQRLFMTGASPTIFQRNGVSSNASNGATVGSWVRSYDSVTNAVTDYLKLGSAAKATGTAAGANAGTAFSLATQGGTFGAIDLSANIVLSSEPSAAQLAAFEAQVIAKYGAGGVLL